MTNQSIPNQDIEPLKAILRELTMTQIRYVIARIENKTDKSAAEAIGISPATVKGWDNKAEVDEAVTLMRVDGMITALEIRRRNLAKAMAVKAAGLESDNEKIRQEVATELIEWELGKAQQAIDMTTLGKSIAPDRIEKTDDQLTSALASLATIAASLAGSGGAGLSPNPRNAAPDDTSGEAQ
jgi:hypothetical protein